MENPWAQEGARLDVEINNVRNLYKHKIATRYTLGHEDVRCFLALEAYGKHRGPEGYNRADERTYYNEYFGTDEAIKAAALEAFNLRLRNLEVYWRVRQTPEAVQDIKTYPELQERVRQLFAWRILASWCEPLRDDELHVVSTRRSITDQRLGLYHKRLSRTKTIGRHGTENICQHMVENGNRIGFETW
ncbi:MAG: hypothetical protein Q9202_002747 [Teloschistes flavicans]